MGISRRTFLGLSGASVLAGLVKKWLPEEEAVLGVGSAQDKCDALEAFLRQLPVEICDSGIVQIRLGGFRTNGCGAQKVQWNNPR